MKRYFFLIAACLIAAGCSRELPIGEHNNFHCYGIRQATLHFEYFGETRGTQDISFDRFGEREAIHIHYDQMTEKGFIPTVRYTVREAGRITIVDSVRYEEQRLIDPNLDSLYRLQTTDLPTAEDQFRHVFSRLGYSTIGDTTIVGLHAHIWQFHKQQSFVYESAGILVGKIDSYLGHTNELRLVSIDTVHVDTTAFRIPHGFQVLDLTKNR
ncbi:MAG TPA: hypothetical protein VGM92_00975 [Candidatus Kapabacteria bacterium]|jgi:hypothetical protein